MREVVDELARANLRLVKIKSDYVAAACPFHKGGQETDPGFWISRETGAWGCFACSERGSNLLTLLKRLGVRNRKAEVILSEALEEAKKTAQIHRIVKARKARAEFRGEHVLPESLLGVYDWCPVQLLKEGFTQETLRAHDIGYDRARERITFPIRDVHGNLIGISGRATSPEVYPRYKVYQGWHEVADRASGKTKRVPGELGEWFPDYSSTDIRNHLWRGNFVFKALFEGTDDQLVVVEGYKAAMWLWQMGWTNVVALMGSRMSQAQERIIRRMGTPTWIFLDNNKAGWEGTADIQDRLGSATFPVYLSSYPAETDEEVQPSDLSVEQTEMILNTAHRAKGLLNGTGYAGQSAKAEQ